MSRSRRIVGAPSESERACRLGDVMAITSIGGHAEPAVADAYVSSCDAGDHGELYGTPSRRLHLAGLARRAVPAL